ncbi:hypothetical protein DFH09DRAFT_1027021 [Mycena vulgaris]|nr:hypothetical protein DFH09DRAFT_1027021 [Mycena vulgaris]
MSVPPPAKRQRTESASITRSTDVWYEDGSVVLQAQDTQFRVHWGVLAQHSPFFRDMKSLPQPPDQPSLEGCPIVEIPDSSLDFEHLLKALYNPLFNNEKAIPFPVLASLVRLGRKYNFDRLLNAAVERLAFDHPTSFEGFCALGKRDFFEIQRILPRPGLLFDIITLARENNLCSVLPYAYYRAIACYLPPTIFDSIARGDGTFATLLPIDQRACVLGRDGLKNAQCRSGYTFGWLQEEATASETNECTNVTRCNKWRNKNLTMLLLSSRLLALGTPDKLGSLCDACKKQAGESTLSGRRKIWEELPTFFDLPPWSELKNEL